MISLVNLIHLYSFILYFFLYHDLCNPFYQKFIKRRKNNIKQRERDKHRCNKRTQ